MISPNSRIQTIIVDDEGPSRAVLLKYIEQYCPSLEIAATCKSVQNAYKAILKYHPGLVFLDIEMPNGSGFDLIKMFEKIDFQVVFITAYSDYATRAFRVSATDFLLKPIKISELIEAVEKVKENIAHDSFQNIISLLENIEPSVNPLRKLVIPNSKGFQVIDPDNIIMCEADGYCTNFYLKGYSRITSSYHLRYYEELLPPPNFLRAHNSFLINISHVIGYTSQGEIQLIESNSCPLSSSRKQTFLKAFRRNKQ